LIINGLGVEWSPFLGIAGIFYRKDVSFQRSNGKDPAKKVPAKKEEPRMPGLSSYSLYLEYQVEQNSNAMWENLLFAVN